MIFMGIHQKFIDLKLSSRIILPKIDEMWQLYCSSKFTTHHSRTSERERERENPRFWNVNQFFEWFCYFNSAKSIKVEIRMWQSRNGTNFRCFPWEFQLWALLTIDIRCWYTRENGISHKLRFIFIHLNISKGICTRANIWPTIWMVQKSRTRQRQQQQRLDEVRCVGEYWQTY